MVGHRVLGEVPDLRPPATAVGNHVAHRLQPSRGWPTMTLLVDARRAIPITRDMSTTGDAIYGTADVATDA